MAAAPRVLHGHLVQDGEARLQRQRPRHAGHDAVTGNHVVRGIKDFSDRMLKGYDQRWGYITVTAYLDGVRFGDDSLAGVRQRPVTPEQADRTVEEFLGDFVPEVVRTEQIAKWYGE